MNTEDEMSWQHLVMAEAQMVDRFVPFLSYRRLAFTLLLVACKKDPVGEFTTDVRIDAAAQTNDPDSTGTKMCTTDNGTVYVLWVDDRDHPNDPGHNDVWMNRSTELGAPGTWLPAPVRVNHSEGRVWNPALHCDDTGVFVVWEDDRDGSLGAHQIYYNTSSDGGQSFLEEDILLELNTDPDGLSVSIEPQITGAGSVMVAVWSDTLFGAPDIMMSSSGDGGQTWNSPIRVDSDEPGEAYSGHPQVAISLSGQDIWIVWEDARNGEADIYFAYSESGGTNFERDQRLDEGEDDGLHDSFSPKLCSDGGANVYAIWHDTRGGEGHDIYMNYSPSGGADWQGVAMRLDSDAAGFGDSLSPSCVAESSILHAIWSDRRETDAGYDIFYRTATAGIPGDPEIRLDTGTPAGFFNSIAPVIAFGDNQMVVAWRDGRGEAVSGTNEGYEDLYYNYSDAETPFDPEGDYRIDSMVDGRSFKQDLNLSLIGGSLYSAWTDARNGTTDIYFTTLGIGEESDPPTAEDLEAAVK